MGIIDMIGRKLILLFFVAVGVVIIFIGYKVYLHGSDHMKEEQAKYDNYVDVMGTVVGHNENDKRQQAVIVEYEVNGVKYKEISDVYSNNYQEVGTQMQIKYNPSKPEEVLWSKDISKNDIIIMAAGGLLMLVGASCSLVNFLNIFRDNTVRRYVKRRPINNNGIQPDYTLDNKSLTEIANERRVGVFDPNQGQTSPYVDPYYNQPGNVNNGQNTNNGNNSVL